MQGGREIVDPGASSCEIGGITMNVYKPRTKVSKRKVANGTKAANFAKKLLKGNVKGLAKLGLRPS